MVEIRAQGRTVPSPNTSDDGQKDVWSTRRGGLVLLEERDALIEAGYGFIANGGRGSTVITFAGVYDADAPDFHLHIPSAKVVVPLSIEVIFEAVGTETTMEIIALASNTGDSSATGTAATIYPMRLDNPVASSCTATVAVDAAGIYGPNTGFFY